MVKQVWPVVCRGDPKKTGSAPSRSFELAMALGRSVRKNQRRNPLSPAGCRSRRRSVGKLRYEAPRSKSSIEIPQKNNETIWFTICHRDRSTAVLRRLNEGHRQSELTGNRPLSEQQGREFTSAFSTKRACDAALQTNVNFAEIRLRPLFGPQSFQPGTPPLQLRKLQA